MCCLCLERCEAASVPYLFITVWISWQDLSHKVEFLPYLSGIPDICVQCDCPLLHSFYPLKIG